MSNEPSVDSTPSGSPAEPSAGVPAPMVWPIVNYADAPAAIRWLCDAFGFIEVVVIPGQDPGVVEHSELAWPEGGGIMAGSAGREGNVFSERATGQASSYVVTDRPDDLFARATAAGAEVVRGMANEDYGSRGFSVRDPEGNIWSFGTYRGEPIPQ